jgi:NADH-quinone oxidoreductase subunit I
MSNTTRCQFWRGLWTTLGSVVERPVTLQYPEQKRVMTERFKGRHSPARYDNGLEKCIGCALCAAACPADAIFVEAAENTDDARYLAGRALRQHLRDQHDALHLLRLLRRRLPDRGDRAGRRLRAVLTSTATTRSTPRKFLLDPVPDRRQAPHHKMVEPGKFNRSIPDMKDAKY